MEILVNGLILGGLYALLAQGFVLTFLTTRTLNFAIGEFVAIGGFVALALASWSWLPDVGKLALAVVVTGVLGAICYRLVVEPFSKQGPQDVGWLLSTVGLSFIIQNLLTNSEGAAPQRLDVTHVSGVGEFAGVGFSWQALLIAVLAVLVTFGLVVMTKRTALGLLMRAVSEDSETAALMGVSPRRVGMLAYAIAMGLAGLAGVLWAGEVSLAPDIGAPLLVAAIAVAVIGGLSSFWGPLLGGAIYGVTTQFASYEFGGVWGQIAGLLIVIVVLVVRPEGLIGKRMEVKV